MLVIHQLIRPGQTFGNFVKQLGDPLFGALPLLFAAAIAVSFTEEAGVAVFNAIIGYLIFSALQSVFIDPKIETTIQYVLKDQADRPNGPIPIPPADGWKDFYNEKEVKETIGYKILFGGGMKKPRRFKSFSWFNFRF